MTQKEVPDERPKGMKKAMCRRELTLGHGERHTLILSPRKLRRSKDAGSAGPSAGPCRASRGGCNAKNKDAILHTSVLIRHKEKYLH